MTRSVLVDVGRTIATITLNRPSAHNAVDRTMAEQIIKSFNLAGLDSTVRVVVLAANGPSFCAGGDFNWVLGWKDNPPTQNLADARLLAGVVQAIAQTPKPTIARVQGPALGGGLGLALACDFLVASTSARLGAPSIKSGVIAAITAPGLVQAVGPRKARQLLLSGQVYGADEAVAMGLADFSVPDSDLDRSVSNLCRNLVQGAPSAQRLSKYLTAKIDGNIYGDSFSDILVPLIIESGTCDEALEGMAAFLTKRNPN